MPVPDAIMQRAMGPQAGAMPTLPRSPAGSPSGPGGSPMLAPGGGAGNAAAARALVNQGVKILVSAMSAMPLNSEEFKALNSALGTLSKAFGKVEDQSLVPATIAQLAMAAKRGQSPMSSVAPPLAPALPPMGGGQPEQEAA